MNRNWTPERQAAFTQHLIEALPYMQDFHGKTMVIKFGGAAMTDQAQLDEFTSDIALLATVGIRPVVVHGGGPMITAMMRRLGKTPEFIDGLRVTDADTVEITEMVLCGTVNGQIVDFINAHGGRAVGLSGKDGGLLKARKRLAPGKTNDDVIDLGYVGDVVGVNPDVIRTLESQGFIPVVSPLASSPDDRHTYNINADTVAGELAKALGAEKLVLLSDTEGVLNDPKNPETVISKIYLHEIDAYIASGVIVGGMIPKVKACEAAVRGGVNKAHIISGVVPHALLLELFSDAGIGTEFLPDPTL